VSLYSIARVSKFALEIRMKLLTSEIRIFIIRSRPVWMSSKLRVLFVGRLRILTAAHLSYWWWFIGIPCIARYSAWVICAESIKNSFYGRLSVFFRCTGTKILKGVVVTCCIRRGIVACFLFLRAITSFIWQHLLIKFLLHLYQIVLLLWILDLHYLMGGTWVNQRFL
jgi:hypothetical protein